MPSAIRALSAAYDEAYAANTTDAWGHYRMLVYRHGRCPEEIRTRLFRDLLPGELMWKLRDICRNPAAYAVLRNALTLAIARVGLDEKFSDAWAPLVAAAWEARHATKG